VRVFIDSNLPMYVAGGEHENREPPRDVLRGMPGISARGAVHAAVMLNHEVACIATFDTGFDRVSGIRRLKLA